MSWANKIYLYHGTDDSGYTSLKAGVRLALCKPTTDFGQGFYTTTHRHQAKQWANMKVLRTPRPSRTPAVVVRFDLDREDIVGLDTLAFVRPTRDFWDLISDCRSGVGPHQRPGLKSEYDVVFGPVTLWPQQLTIFDCDQVSFHTDQAVRKLTPYTYFSSKASNKLF